MQTCREFEALLSSYAKEELHVLQSERVAAHIARCEHCRREVETYRQLADRIRNLPAPELPEHAVQEFARAVLRQIAEPQPRRRSRAFDFFSSPAQQRWRYGLAGLAVLAFTLAVGLWYAPLEQKSRPATLLAPLLQARAWDQLYEGLLKKETRALLLHEPVPTELAKTALLDLLEKGAHDKRIRTGLRQLFVSVATHELALHEASRSAKILGVITARGYRPASHKRSRGYDPEKLLRKVQKLPAGTEITLAELVKSKD